MQVLWPESLPGKHGYSVKAVGTGRLMVQQSSSTLPVDYGRIRGPAMCPVAASAEFRGCSDAFVLDENIVIEPI